MIILGLCLQRPVAVVPVSPMGNLQIGLAILVLAHIMFNIAFQGLSMVSLHFYALAVSGNSCSEAFTCIIGALNTMLTLK